jgi:DNA-binding phage protein
MPVRTTGVYIVPDDAKVVRVSELIETVKRTKSVRQAAQEIGVSQATVSRALESEGYEVRTTTEIVRPEEGH